MVRLEKLSKDFWPSWFKYEHFMFMIVNMYIWLVWLELKDKMQKCCKQFTFENTIIGRTLRMTELDTQQFLFRVIPGKDLLKLIWTCSQSWAKVWDRTRSFLCCNQLSDDSRWYWKVYFATSLDLFFESYWYPSVRMMGK